MCFPLLHWGWVVVFVFFFLFFEKLSIVMTRDVFGKIYLKLKVLKMKLIFQLKRIIRLNFSIKK